MDTYYRNISCLIKDKFWGRHKKNIIWEDAGRQTHVCSRTTEMKQNEKKK